jgi:hypothetical protein
MDGGDVIEKRWTLFDGRASEDRAQVWLEPSGGGVRLRTQEWGPGVEHHFGWDTIETSLGISAPALSVLALFLVAERPEVDPTGSPMEVLAAAYRGDSAASAHVRQRLEALGLEFDFIMR